MADLNRKEMRNAKMKTTQLKLDLRLSIISTDQHSVLTSVCPLVGAPSPIYKRTTTFNIQFNSAPSIDNR
jgi:hypothetical protein